MAVDEERLEAAARNSARVDSTGTWLGGAQKDNLWKWPLAEKRKSGISGKRDRRFPEQLGKLEEKEDEEREPATKRRREYRFREI